MAAFPAMTTAPRSRDLMAAEVQYFRLEPRYWETILLRLKESGLRCVTSYVPWEVHAVAPPDRKHPAGVLDFTGRTDPRRNLLGFLELVEKHGLLLNFRAGPFCCNEMPHGGFPEWLVLGDPGMMVWDWQNRMTQGYWIARKEGSQPSYLHPAYLSLVRHWIAAVGPIAREHLQSRGGCVALINLDNEVSYIVRDSFLESDYNPVNVRPGGFYHRFLREKYESPDRLPYGRRFRSFEEVEPPRRVPQAIGEGLAWYLDWIEFKTWCMTRFLRILRSYYEEEGVRDVRFMTNFNPHLPEGVPTRMPDFEAALGPGGLAGYDFYRGTFMSVSGYHSMARVLKLMNASLNYTWAAEFMAGTWNKVLSTRVSDDHMRFMARCALAQGCKAISWFMFHDRDCWGDAPVSFHGHPRPSLQVLRDTVALVTERIRHWDDLEPQTDCAILYVPIHHQHTAIGDPSPCADNDTYVGPPSVAEVPAGLASLEYYGLFRLIEEAGWQAGVVDLLARPERLRNYSLAFLPGAPLLDEVSNRRLAVFVNRGGTLVLTGAWPVVNHRGRPLRLLGLSRPRASGGGIVMKRIGRGRLIWSPGWIAQEKPEEERLDAIRLVRQWLTQWAGEPAVHIEPETLPVRWVDWGKGGQTEFVQPRNLGSAVLHESRDERILFVLNHYPDAVRFRLRFHPRYPVTALTDLDTGEHLAVRNRTVVVDVDRKAAAIWHVESA